MMNPEIMLFGTKILLPENSRREYSSESCVESGNGSGGAVDCDRCLDGDRGIKGDVEEKQEQVDEDQEVELCETTEQDEVQNPGATEESHNTNPSSYSDENPKTPSANDDVASTNHPKTENEQSGSSTDAQSKTLKKPDKIPPCPRCNSTDTKFCYYNNYNVNQPRHFCKGCQRYWTAGGTIRNVPVGAGRRKNKNYYASHCRHVTISEARIDHMKLKSNGSVLSFGPDLAEKGVVSNGYYKVSCKNGENINDCRNGLQLPVMQNPNGFQSPFVPFPYPAIYPPGYPMPYYYTPPVWNCNVPWLSVQSPTANQKSIISSGPSSPLGKHSRNGELLKTNNSEGKEPKKKNLESSIVVPKTLRIDDPEEAAKSSIWSTLGIKYDSYSREGLLKALQPKGDKKKSTVAASPLLQANPAALSRSISFQEKV